MTDYSKAFSEWETKELLIYLTELGETKYSSTWISPIGEEKLKELDDIINKVIEEVMSRTTIS